MTAADRAATAAGPSGRWLRVTRWQRALFFVAIDFLLLSASGLLALALRFDGVVPRHVIAGGALVAAGFAAVSLAVLSLLGVYKASWSFVGLRDIARVAVGILAATAALGIVVNTFHGRGVLEGFPRSVLLIQVPIAFCAVSGFRLSKRAWNTYARRRGHHAGLPTLLVGAGESGEQVLKSIQQQGASSPYRVVGFVDDDPLALRTSIHGVRVLGPVASLGATIARHRVSVVIVCVTSATSPFVRDVVRDARKAGAGTIRIVPPLAEIVDGRLSVQMTREVSLEDLLGRERVEINVDEVRGLVSGRRVLVTGGAGTIGSELCRQVARLAPESLVVLDIDESRLHDICMDLRRLSDAPRIVEALVDVRDSRGLRALMEAQRFHVVFHAAAYKHVPMMERWPVAALDVNVVGTANVVSAAEQSGCERFVLISTDKAVEPSSIMGASKRLAEIVTFASAVTGNGQIPMRRSAVRFGNVIGSRGSVIPTFRAQLTDGGPLTVTHPDMERFFMMTSEAVSLVLQAASLGEGGEIFILDMGKPVRILDVAHEFIRLNGLEPDGDVGVVFTGLRPGEKLREVLNYPDEKLVVTRHPRILKTTPRRDDGADKVLATVGEVVAARDHAWAREFLTGRFPTLETSRVAAGDGSGGSDERSARADPAAS